jgi:hypothetical protein
VARLDLKPTEPLLGLLLPGTTNSKKLAPTLSRILGERQLPDQAMGGLSPADTFAGIIIAFSGFAFMERHESATLHS